MEAKLIVVGGKASKKAISVTPPAVIGRSREVQLTVAHPMISRQHCEIFEVDGLLMIRDLGSLNGTVVQGQRIAEAPLCPDDEFTVGPLTFRAEYEYHGDLDAVPDPKLYEGAAQQPQAETGQPVPDFEPVGEMPSADFIDESGSEAADGQLPDFAAWDKMAAEAVSESEAEDGVDEVEDLTEFETLGKEGGQEEPEPTPPPVRQEPATGEATEEAADQPVKGETIKVDELEVEEEDQRVAGPAEGDAPARTTEDEKVEWSSDFFAAINPEAGRPASAENSDEDLDKFLRELD